MAKAKGKAAANKTRDEQATGVHIISEKDTKRHFGPSAGKQNVKPTDNPETSTAADADRETADVRLTLGRGVLRNAEAAASKQGIELSRYVELALEQYRRE